MMRHDDAIDQATNARFILDRRSLHAKYVFGLLRTACASVQSDKDRHFPLPG